MMINGRAFVISLRDSDMRRQHMTNVLSKASIPFEFFDAIDGRGRNPESLSSLYSSSQSIKAIGYPMIGAQVAILLSHLELYKKIIDLDLPWALILEDDIRIVRPIRPILDNISRLPSEWDVVKLCYYRNSIALRNYVLSIRRRKSLAHGYRLGYFTENMHSCAAYLISKKGAFRMVKIIEQGFCQPIDHYTGDISSHQLYGVIPKPVEIDLRLGFASSVAKERSCLGDDPSYKKTWFRSLLRRSCLFLLFKNSNLIRLEIQKPVSHVLYVLSRPWLLFYRPPVGR